MLRSVLLCCAIFLIAGSDVPGESFLKYAPDVPVIEGFGETDELGSILDKPDGRYVEAWLTGRKPADDALKLYRKSLPQYGWTIESEIRLRDDVGPTLTFSRKTESLYITVTAQASRVTVLRIRIVPRWD